MSNGFEKVQVNMSKDIDGKRIQNNWRVADVGEQFWFGYKTTLDRKFKEDAGFAKMGPWWNLLLEFPCMSLDQKASHSKLCTVLW